MAMLSRGAMVVGALAVLLQSGCAERATRPTVTRVDLSLAASPSVGSPSQPVAADVRISNVGTTRVWHCVGCGCGNGIAFTVLGPDGVEVLLNDPNAPVPACADGFEPLEPGRDLGARLAFTGTLYVNAREWPTPTYEAPPGTYTVVARFHYATSVPGEWIPLERRVTFDWAP